MAEKTMVILGSRHNSFSVEVVHEKPFSDQVIDLYESCLQRGLIISTSFKNVVENKMDSKRRWLQFSFLFFLFFNVVIRQAILCSLYLKDEETKKKWEFYLPNYLEQFGLFGKLLNFVYLVFGSIIFIDLSHFRVFESKGRMDFLIYAGNLKGGKDSCRGDGGGPLLLKRNNGNPHEMQVLLGIIAYGMNTYNKGVQCGAKYAGSVYTKISSYLGWIEDVTDK